MKLRSAFIAAMMVIAFILGLWLLFSPRLEQLAALDKQQELIEDIEDMGGEAGSDKDTLVTAAGFYEETPPPPAPSNESEPAESVESTIQPPALPEPLIAPEPSANPQIIETPVPVKWTALPGQTAPTFTERPVPLADTEFHGSVTGLGILTIDKIDLRLPVAEGISESGLKIALGHVPETASVGETGNAVIAGHRSYAYGQFFNRLDEMEIGDIIVYQAKSGEVMDFEVFETAEIYPGDQIAFIQPKDESIITLYTCTPVRVATHRLIVRAKKLFGGAHE